MSRSTTRQAHSQTDQILWSITAVRGNGKAIGILASFDYPERQSGQAGCAMSQVIQNLTRVEGPNLSLRLIQPDDAEYVHGLRTHPAYNQHLSAVQGTAGDQRRWIEGYKAREAAESEFYYVIERKDGKPCGLVRLYDIGPESFTWGSWILDVNKPPKAALESAVIVYQIAFDLLGLFRAEFDVRRDNEKTLAFHRRFGATETERTVQDIYFVYLKERFEADLKLHLAVLKETPL